MAEKGRTLPSPVTYSTLICAAELSSLRGNGGTKGLLSVV